jgi:hypothetical protein
MALSNDEGETLELVNAARVKAYTDNLAPAIGLRGCDDCEGLDEALGETYTNPTDDFAPWYDPTDPATADFYGVYPLAFDGIDDSTRSIESAELIGDGSVVVNSRFTGKDIRVSGVAFAKDEAALNAGVSWLNSALNGTEEGRCFGDRLNLYSSCPAIEVLPPDFAEPYTLDQGTPSRMNLIRDPRATDATKWNGTFGTGGAGTETMVGGAGDGPVLPDGTQPTTYARYTWTTGNTGGSPVAGYTSIATDPPPLPGPFPAGTPFAAAIYVRPSVAVPTAFPYVSQQVGGADGPNVNLPSQALPANVWTRIGGTDQFTVVAETVNSHGVVLSAFDMPVGETLDVVAAMVTPYETTLGDYFDGYTTDAGGFVYGWVGETDASESVEIPEGDIDAEAAQWTTTSGTIEGTADGVDFNWDPSDYEKVACREVTGLIPGEQYQLRLRLAAYGDYYVSVGPDCVERYENLFTDPRLTATVMSTNGATVVDTRPSSGAPDGGSYFNRLVVASNTSSPMTMPMSPTGTSATPVVDSQQYTASWYESGAPDTGSALILDGVSPGRASTPDTAVLDITGDLDVRAHVALDDWASGANQALITKWAAAGTRSYLFQVRFDGRLRLYWSTDGAGAIESAFSTVAVPVTNGEPLWVRATIDVDNGAAGRDITFYTSTDGVTWTQLGSTVTQAGVTSIFSANANVDIGSNTDGTLDRLAGHVFSAEIRNGIAGTVVTNPNFNIQPAGTTSFIDGTGKTWTVTAPGVIGDAPSGGRVDWTWYDNAGAEISSETGSYHGETTGWERFTQTMTAPVGAEFVQVRLVITGFPVAEQEISLAQAQLNRGPTAADYIDGSYPDVRWTGTANDSTSLLEENVDYQTIFGWGTAHDPPTEPTVLDFVARSDSTFISIQPTDRGSILPTLDLLVEDALIRRVARPGVISFGTGDDAVPPSDGWTHLAPAGMEVTWYLNGTSVHTIARNPSGGSSSYLSSHGVERTVYGLEVGSRYRLMVEFDTSWAETDADPQAALIPIIDISNASGIVQTYEDDNLGTFQYFRVVEFSATATSAVLFFHPSATLSLGSFGSVSWLFHEYMVEEILEADETPPSAGRTQERTMYEVKASQGPILTNVRTSPCGVMGQITYSLRAGNPFKYRSPVFAGGLPSGVSQVVADVPCSADGLAQVINFAYNPSLETNAVDWSASGTSVTSGRTNVFGGYIGDYLFQATAVPGVGRVDSITMDYSTATAASGPVPEGGQEITLSFYVRTMDEDSLGTYEWTIDVTMDGFAPIPYTGSIEVSVAETWYRVEHTFTLPDNIDLDTIEASIFLPTAVLTGGEMHVDALMIQSGGVATDPFDETFPDAVWSGTANQSALVLTPMEEDLSADPDCPTPPAPPAPPTIDEDCITDPSSYTRTVVEIPDDTVPRNLTAYPVITLVAGSADVRQARIRFWENPSNLTIDQLDPCSYDGEIIVSYLASGATMVIDGVLREATVSKPGFADQNANHVLYGPDGGPVDWPELTGGIPYLVTLELDSTATYSDTLMTVNLVVRD